MIMRKVNLKGIIRKEIEIIIGIIINNITSLLLFPGWLFLNFYNYRYSIEKL